MKKVRTKQGFSLVSIGSVALVMLLASCALSSCVKGEIDSSGSINPTANVLATTQTKAAIKGTTFPAATDNVFRLTAFTGAAAPTDWSTTPYFNDIQVNSGAASALALATTQYYPVNGDKVFFYGYAPQATSLTAGTALVAPIANYTITGQEDIMAAQVTTGIAKATTGTQPQPNLAFTHKLMQLRFKTVKDISYEAGKKVTEILVKGVKTSAKLDITTGVLIFDGNADQTLSLPIVAGTKDEIVAGGTEMDGNIMLEPVGTNGSVMLKITAGGIIYDNVKVTLTGDNNGKAGTSHLITLNFKRENITPTATITDWSDTGSGSADVGVLPRPTVGDYYYSDGSFSTDFEAGKTATGMIYYIDPADAMKYKVMSLEESSVKWAANTSYVVSGARSDVDGKANSAAIKAAFDSRLAGVSISESTFDAAFPAAAYCYNYKGKAGTDAVGSWYLPAKSELQYLWCSYNGVAPISWASGTNTSAPVVPAAQTLWNNRIKAGGVTVGIASGYFWSSTEDSSITSYAWYVYFSNGSTNSYGKSVSSYVRCVRDL